MFTLIHFPWITPVDHSRGSLCILISWMVENFNGGMLIKLTFKILKYILLKNNTLIFFVFLTRLCFQFTQKPLLFIPLCTDPAVSLGILQKHQNCRTLLYNIFVSRIHAFILFNIYWFLKQLKVFEVNIDPSCLHGFSFGLSLFPC